MTARRTDEVHRTATPLELFFDLCFVVAVAQAAGRLHLSITEGHAGSGVTGYLTVFFAIWWAWMNFTWFASAYDTDDTAYRLMTLVQIAGALVLAAGVSRAFDGDFRGITYAYVVLRLSMVGQWLRAAHADRDRRATALRFAIGITLTQVGWMARLALPDSWAVPSFLVLVAAEVIVPLVAESAGRTTWHAEHIAERYGLFTLIVLGESVLAASNAVGSALDGGSGLGRLLSLAGAGTVVVFSMWWLYFDQPMGDLPLARGLGFFWGYGHYLVFASAAAVGAGLSVAVDGGPHSGYAVAVPVAGYVLAVWIVQVWPYRRKGLLFVGYPVAAALVLLAPLRPGSLVMTAALLAILAGFTAWCRIDAARRRAAMLASA